MSNEKDWRLETHRCKVCGNYHHESAMRPYKSMWFCRRRCYRHRKMTVAVHRHPLLRGATA